MERTMAERHYGHFGWSFTPLVWGIGIRVSLHEADMGIDAFIGPLYVYLVRRRVQING